MIPYGGEQRELNYFFFVNTKAIYNPQDIWRDALNYWIQISQPIKLS
jgi:hypothetical protein